MQKAIRCLRAGSLVAFPTETVYGLGADATNPDAVCKIFETKKRPVFNPLIVHVHSFAAAKSLWKKTPAIVHTLADHFWPGPLTLVLPKSDIIPDIVTAGLPTVAVRIPRHPVALELLRLFGGPIAAPSANLFGSTSPTSALAVAESLGRSVPIILDGGASGVGLESTVVKVEPNGELTLLRPGGVGLEELEALNKKIKIDTRPHQGILESPGQLTTHYAPRTPMVLLEREWRKMQKDVLRLHGGFARASRRWPKIGILTLREDKTPISPATKRLALSADGSLHEVAFNLFEGIRKLDKMGLDLLAVETCPERGIGFAVMDRLNRASSGKKGLIGLLITEYCRET